ncbi:MAG: GTP-binding protein, partial [Candidatus Cloacimonadota bacterium]
MRDFCMKDIRNVMLCGHGGVGKTTIAEAMLFNSGVLTRLGRVDDGNSAMDYDQLEIDRKVTISLAIGNLDWKDAHINILDTPGYADFRGEVISAASVSDGVIIVVDSTAGIEVGTEWVWELTRKQGIPGLFFVNALSKENAHFFKVLEEIQNVFRKGIVPLSVPIGQGEQF